MQQNLSGDRAFVVGFFDPHQRLEARDVLVERKKLRLRKQHFNSSVSTICCLTVSSDYIFRYLRIMGKSAPAVSLEYRSDFSSFGYNPGTWPI
jgi:hypothetical protein